ncbi:MAG: transporter ATP-binding protein [Bacillales bacterium]|jgi:ABC-2 type transport system ATP-binding protein|nr:transporter ATP-binding protein [Bacillales bacterium]
MSKILQVENLTKTVKGKNLVENIEFSVNAGEVFGFLGPNGSGKTTTIRMLVGLIKPTNGRVTIAGHDVFKDFKEAMKNVGCIVENPELYGFLTGWEVLKQYARMQGNISDDRLREIVEQVNLTERIHDRVKTYSLGMKQRLGIGQALIGRPRLLILDEPTNGLDPAGIKELREFVRFLVEKEKMSVFISSHLLSEIQMMCDRVAIIDRGRMVTVSTVEDLLHHHSGDVVEWIAEPIERARDIIASFESVSNITIRDKSILCKVDQTLISEIVQKLTSNGIAVSKVAEKTITLEDLFMQLTTGSKPSSSQQSSLDLKEVH